MLVKCSNPACGQAVSVSEETAGQWVRCPQCGTSFMQVSADLPVQIARFQIRAVLGRGAFGTVYRAYDPELEREVALKLLHADALDNVKAVERFLREAKASARLRHSHIVPVYESGKEADRPFLVSALIEGQPLAELAKHGPLDCREAARLVRHLAEALAYAHEQGVVHRDVKPANVMIDRKGQPYLMDFGLAHRQDARTRLTRVGALMGTPGYMAPELVPGPVDRPDPADPLPASDQYSLGVILYELLYGQAPFSGPAQIVLYHTVHTPPPGGSAFRGTVPAELERICFLALAKSPQERFPGCQQMADALGEWLAQATTPLTTHLRTTHQKEESRLRAGAEERLPARLVSWCRRHWRPAGAGATAVLTLFLGVWLLAGLLTGEKEPQESNVPELEPEPLGAEYWALVEAAADAVKGQRYEGALQQLDAIQKRWPGHNPLVDKWRNEAVAGKERVEKAKAKAAVAKKRGETALARFEAALGQAEAALQDWQYPQAIKKVAEALSLRIEVENSLGKQGFPAEHWQRPDEIRKAAEKIQETMLQFDAAMVKADQALQDKHYQKTLENTDEAVKVLSQAEELFGKSAESERRLQKARQLQNRVLMKFPEKFHELHTVKGHTERIRYLFFSPDGSRLVSVASDKTQSVKIWDVATGWELRSLVNVPFFNPDGSRYAVANPDNTVSLIETATGKELVTFGGHTGQVNYAAFTKDGTRLVTASADKTMKLWEVASGRELHTFRGHTGKVFMFVFNRDGSRLFSSSADKTVKVWEAATGKELWSFQQFGYVLFVSPDGSRVAFAAPGTVKLLESSTARQLQDLTHSDPVLYMVFSRDGSRLATASFKSAKLWDLTTGKELAALAGAPGRLMFSPDGSRLASVSRGDKKVKLLQAATGKELQTLEGHADAVTDLAYSPEGSRLVTASKDSTVKVWHAGTGQELGSLKGHTGPVSFMRFSAAGSRLATASEDGTVKLWGPATASKGSSVRLPPRVPWQPPSTEQHVVGHYEPSLPAEKSILLQAQDKPSGWKALTVKEPEVYSGRRLVSLPGCRSAVTLKSGIRLTLWGHLPELWPTPPLLESVVEIHHSTALTGGRALDLDLTLHRGRIALRNALVNRPTRVRVRWENPTNPESKEFLDLSVGDKSAEIMIDRWSLFTVREGFYKDRKDPNRLGPWAQLAVIVLAGEAYLGCADQTVLLRSSGNTFPVMLWDSAKGWTGPNQLNKLPETISAAPALPPGLDPKTRTAKLRARDEVITKMMGNPERVLEEAKRSADSSVRCYAVRCFGAIDDLENLMTCLNDQGVLAHRRPEFRQEAITTLQLWIASSRDAEYQLYDLLKTRWGLQDDASIVMDLLHNTCYSDKIRSRPETYETLILRLAHHRQIVCELAAWHLYRLVPEGRQIPYSAVDDPAMRRRAQESWRKLIPPGKLPPQAK